MKTQIILAATLLIAVCAAAQRKAPKLPSHATSSIEKISRKDCSGYLTTNRTYEMLKLISEAGAPLPLLLLETFENERCDGQEGIRGRASITAWALDANGNKKLQWTIRSNGNSGSLEREGLLTILEWGCCDVPTTYRYYSLYDGRALYVTNSELVEVQNTGEDPILVGFGYPRIHDPSRPPRLQLGTSTRVLQSLDVISHREYYDQPTISVSASAGQKSIVLTYRDGVELRFPMDGELINQQNAQLPLGYSMRSAERQ